MRSLLLLIATFARPLGALSVDAAPPRTILVTGATDGIGRHTACRLASDGNHLLIHGRRPEEGAELRSNLLSRGAASVRYFNADLADLEQVESLARDIISSGVGSIDVLINNAGIFDPPSPAKSRQGYDETWAVNCMAPFLLTRRLLPLVAASADGCPRIVTTSSLSPSRSLPSLDELFDINERPKSGHQAYSDSKLGDFLFTVVLSRLLREHADSRFGRIKCLTMDPGTVNTKMLIAGWGACGIPVSRADNTYKLATAFGAEQESGTYHFGGGGSADAKDEKKVRALWDRWEQTTGCTYADIGANCDG